MISACPRLPATPAAAWTCWVALLLAALSLLLAGCGTTVVGADGREIRTDSDQTSPERRARVRLELASLYFGRGQASTALDEVKQAIAAKDDMPEAFSLRGLIYASMGEPALADESFRRALQLSPRDPDVLQNHAWVLCQQRRFDEANAQFVASLAAPQQRDAVRTLLSQGVCQARAGRYADAERTLSRSYEIDPTNPVTAFNLADVLLRRGEIERARFYVGRINNQAELVSAQSLWLSARIEQRRGDTEAVRTLGRTLRDRFPQSPETLRFERGNFDE